MAARATKARASRVVAAAPATATAAPEVPQQPSATVLLPQTRQHSYFGDFMLFEVVAASAMLLMAATIVTFPDSIRFSGFSKLEAIYLDALPLAVLFFIISIGRCWALMENGRLPKAGPAMRAVGAALGLVIWLQMLYALASWSMGRGFLSLSCALFLCVAGGEVVSLCRAVRDGRS